MKKKRTINQRPFLILSIISYRSKRKFTEEMPASLLAKVGKCYILPTYTPNEARETPSMEGEPKSHSPRNELTKTSMTSLSSNFGCSNRKGCADRMNETKGVNENPVHPSPKKKVLLG